MVGSGRHARALALVATLSLVMSVVGTGLGALTAGPAGAIGTATHFDVSYPPTEVANAAKQVTVTAKTASNATDTAYSGAANLTDDFGHSLGTATFTPGTGVATANVALKDVGNRHITAADSVNPLVTGTSGVINVVPTLQIVPVRPHVAVTDPSGTINGFSVTVSAVDGYGTTIPTYARTVTFSAGNNSETIPSDDYTFTGSGAGHDNGSHTFTGLFVRVLGDQTITVTDTTYSDATATATVTGEPRLDITGSTAAQTAGTARSVTVTARDFGGNVVPTYTGTAQLTTDDPLVTVPVSHTFTGSGAGNDNGVSSMSITLKTAGSHAVIATDTQTTASATLSGVAVTPAAPAQLGFSALPPSITAGTPTPVTVTALDAYGNTTPSYVGTVTLTPSNGDGPITSDYVATDAGAHTFTITPAKVTSAYHLDGSGTTATTPITGSSASVAVVPASATTLVVTTFPSPSTAGTAGPVRVEVRDAFGNVATGYRGSVTFGSNDPQATFPTSTSPTHSYQFTAGDGGVHVFDGTDGLPQTTLRTVGTDRTITVTDAADATITGSQTGITVTPAALAGFRVSEIPDTVTAGTLHDVRVTAIDSYGNTRPDYVGQIGFTSSDPSAVLPGTYTFVAADTGTHLFAGGVALKTAGVRTVTATDTANAAITGVQSGLDVVAAPASQLLVQGVATPTTAGTAQTVTVTARDPYQNTATTYLGTITFASSDPQAQAPNDLPTDYTFTAGDGGTHTFPGGVTLKTAGSQSVSATDTSAATITGSQAGIVVTPAATRALAITGLPTSTAAGTAATFIVTAKDAYGNTTPAYTGKVRFSATDTQATVPGDYSFTGSGAGNDNGVHAFTNGATFRTAGARSLTAADNLSPQSTGAATTTVSPASTAALRVDMIPSTVAAGASNDVRVTAIDAFGNTTPGYTGTIHFTSNAADATVPGDYTFSGAGAGNDNGTRTFTKGVRFTVTASGRSVTATDATTGSITGSETGITVGPAAAASIDVSGYPTPQAGTAAGTAGTVTLTVRDSLGNVATNYRGTVHFTSTDPQATLPTDYTFAAADNGAHTFSNGVTLRTAGTQSITATDAVADITGSETGILIVHGAPILVVSGVADPVLTGAGSGVTVSAADAYGNPVVEYAGSISFSSSDGTASLPAGYTFTGSGAGHDNGTHTFGSGLVLRTVGPQSVTATDTSTPSITGTRTAIDVKPILVVSGAPSQPTAGTTFSVTVTAKNSFGTTATAYTGTVHFTSTDSQAALPADHTFTSGDAGAHTFTNGVVLRTAGPQSITATDSELATATGSESGIAVKPAAATTLTVAGISSPRAAGTPSDVTVTAKDAYGNIASGYTGTIHFTSSDAQAAPPADYPFTAPDNGTHTFAGGVTFYTAGAQSLSAADTAPGSSISGSQSGIAVTAGPAATLVVAGVTSPTTAGTARDVNVTVKDAYGNTATGYTGTVHFTSTDGGAALPSDYTFASGDNGAHAFTGGITLKTAGTQSVTATDTAISSVTGTQSGITVTPAATWTLAVSGIASPTTAGAARDVTVTAEDAYGNTTAGYRGTVHFTSTDAQAGLPADYTFVAGDNGAHTFTGGVTLKTAGTRSVTATDTAASAITGTQSGIVVTPATPSTLVLSGLPSSTTAGTPLDAIVSLRDAYGNTATGYRGTVHFTSSDAQATLPGDYGFTSGDAGSHTFAHAVTLQTAGNQTVHVADTGNAGLSATATVAVAADQPPPPPVAARDGYWLVDRSGVVYPFGAAQWMGDAPVGSAGGVDIEGTPDGGGYWVLDSIGHVHAFGDAPFFGEVTVPAGERATAMSALPDGRGYWIFTDKGRVHAFGAAGDYGDMGGTPLNGAVIGSVATPSGHGYYMVASDGGIFAFGDAAFYGSMGGQRLNQPVVGLVPDPDGAGYWLVAADGGVFAFDAGFRGSTGDMRLNQPIIGMVAYGDGYLMVASDGGVFDFSDKPFSGSLGDQPQGTPVTNIATLPS